MHSPSLRLRHTALASATLCLGLTLQPQAASAQQAIESQASQAARAARFDIPAQPLASALDMFARQAGLQLVFDPSLAARRQAPAVQGERTARQALDELLKGSGLQGRMEEGTLTVRPAPVATGGERSLAEVRVAARRASDGTTEGTGAYTSRVTSIASKTDQAFREIPQSVSVVTRQQMEDRQVTDVEQALALAPGVIVADNSGRYFSRGFQITSMQIDGGAPLALGAYAYQPQQDMAFYDRVEVMRGASGLLGGVGDPGGIINLVRKKPSARRQLNVSVSAGNWNHLRTEIDASGPLGLDGQVRGRAVMAYQNSDSFFDYISLEKPSLYGVLEADLSPQTMVTLGASYGKVRQTGDYGGLPRFSDGRSLGLARNTVFSNPWSYFHYENKEVFAQLEHRFDNRWKLKLDVSHAETSQNRLWSSLSGPVDPVTLAGPLWRGGRLESANRQDVVDLNLSGSFSLLGRTHELLLGADWQRVRSHWQNLSFAQSGVTGGNVFDIQPWNPDFNAYNLDFSERYGPWGQEQMGGYGVLRLHPTDRLHVIAGARVSKYDFVQHISNILDTAGSTSAWSSKSFKESAKVTPYGGVIYDLTPQWSAYASYSSIFKPQALYMSGPLPGNPLPPIKGRSYEAGLKGELLDGKVNATFSVFSVERTGTAVLDERYAEKDSLWGASCCYLSQGKVTSRGFDAEVGGEVLPGWQLAAGYTFNQTRDASTQTSYSSITPKHLLKLSTAYTLPGPWSQWRIGGSATIQSAHHVSGAVTAAGGASEPYNFTQGGYALWNAMVQYRIDPQWSLSLNVNNLFDKTYYQTLAGVYNGNMQGLPRNAMLTLRGSF